MPSKMNILTQRINIIISIVLAYVWFQRQGEIEPLIGILAGLTALFGSFFPDEQSEKNFLVRAKGVLATTKQKGNIIKNFIFGNIGVEASSTLILIGIVLLTILFIIVLLVNFIVQFFNIEYPFITWINLSIGISAILSVVLLVFGGIKYINSNGKE